MSNFRQIPATHFWTCPKPWAPTFSLSNHLVAFSSSIKTFIFNLKFFCFQKLWRTLVFTPTFAPYFGQKIGHSSLSLLLFWFSLVVSNNSSSRTSSNSSSNSTATGVEITFDICISISVISLYFFSNGFFRTLSILPCQASTKREPNKHYCLSLSLFVSFVLIKLKMVAM